MEDPQITVIQRAKVFIKDKLQSLLRYYDETEDSEIIDMVNDEIKDGSDSIKQN